jgi:hypothetical protein
MTASSIRRRARSSTVAVRAVVLLVAWALLLGGSLPRHVEAAGAKTRSPARFFESLLGKEPPEPDFIPLPQPPSSAEVARLAAVPGKSAARPAAPVPPASVPRAEEKPPRLPTWNETVAFGTALQVSTSKVIRDAADPEFQPRPRPAAPPAPPTTLVITARAGSRRQTPPIVATKLQATGMPAPRTRRFERLRANIARTLATYQRRPLNTAQHTPWEVMHGFIAFGIPTQIRVGGPAGDLVNAIGWSNMGTPPSISRSWPSAASPRTRRSRCSRSRSRSPT